MLDFHNRTKILDHLRYKSNICKMQHLLNGPIVTAAEADELDLADHPRKRALHAKGLKPSHSDFLVVRVPGPLPQPILDESMYSSHHPLGVGRRYYS